MAPRATEDKGRRYFEIIAKAIGRIIIEMSREISRA